MHIEYITDVVVSNVNYPVYPQKQQETTENAVDFKDCLIQSGTGSLSQTYSPADVVTYNTAAHVPAVETVPVTEPAPPPAVYTTSPAAAAAAAEAAAPPAAAEVKAPAAPATPPAPPAAEASAAASVLGSHYPVTEAEVIPKIRELRYIINNTDMSGKTDVEKYDIIEQRFKDSFGNEFMMARNLNLPSSTYYIIGIEFTDTLRKHIDDPEQVNRVRLYGDADAGKIQESIREKYPSSMTNRDMFMMVNEMRNSGVLDNNSLRVLGGREVMDTLSLLKSYIRYNPKDFNEGLRPLSLADRDKQWMNLMNRPFESIPLMRMYNEWMERDLATHGKDSAPFIVNHLGGEMCGAGYFIIPGSGCDGNDWVGFLTQILNEMDEYEEHIRALMQAIDAEEYVPVEETAGAEENLDGVAAPGAEDAIVPDDHSPEAEAAAGESAGDQDSGEDTGSSQEAA